MVLGLNGAGKTMLFGIVAGVLKPAILVVDGDGIIRYKWVAPSPGTLPNFDEVKQALY